MGTRSTGCATGIPKPLVVVVYGGPGGAMPRSWGTFFDPERWNRVFFDQRGCGESTPFGGLHANTLDYLVLDMERLRAHLGVNRWALFGGSWGTTLAMAYGVTFPQRCTGFLLRGVFLARPEDWDWFLWGAGRVFPEAHRAFLDAIEVASGVRPRHVQDILSLSEGPLQRVDAAGLALACAWANYEYTVSFVEAPSRRPSVSTTAEQRKAVAMALLERHYVAQAPAPLVARLGAVAHLPCEIVHGRVDLACTADQADAVARAWPGSNLVLVDGAGHGTFEPSNERALYAAAGRLLPAVQQVLAQAAQGLAWHDRPVGWPAQPWSSVGPGHRWRPIGRITSGDDRGQRPLARPGTSGSPPPS